MSDTIKIADLLAQFQLDAGPLIKGLEDSEVRLDAVGARVVSVNALLKSLGEGGGGALGARFQKEFANIRAAAELAQEQRQIQRALDLEQEKELQRMLVEEEKAALAEKQAARASYIAWWERTIEEQALKEKALMAEIRAIEKRDIVDQKAERARYQAWWERNTREMQAAQMEANASLVKNVTSSQIGQQIAMAQTARAMEDSTAKTLINSFKLRTEAQAITELIGVKGLGVMARLVSYSPIVASALSSAFDVVMVVAFIDILVQAGNKFEELIRDAEGFDKASIKAWDDARIGSENATKALLKYQEAQRGVEAAGLKGASKYDTEGKIASANLVDQKKHLVELQGQARSMAQLLSDARFSDPSLGFKEHSMFGLPSADEDKKWKAAIDRLYEQGDTVQTLAAKYKHLQDEIRETATEIGKLGQTIEKDKLKEERAPIRGQHRLRGPEDNEEPNRLPWYLGPNAAQSFANRVHGQRMAGLPSATGRMFARADSDAGTPAPQASVQVVTTINPQFTFHGVPADIQAFMRDHAEPQLAKDIENNTRGIGARVASALKESGMVVSGV